jgi:hypothetical protein
MEAHLKIIGVILIFLSLLHFIFPRYFNWKQELPSLTLINQQLMYVHTFFIAFVVLLMGVFCLVSFNEIVNTSLGRKLALGLCFFWTVRLLFQFFVYSPKLWKGKLFETTVHIVFSFLWAYLSTIFFLIFWN